MTAGVLAGSKAAASAGIVPAGTTLAASQAPVVSSNGDYRLLVTADGQLAEQSVNSIYPIYQVLYGSADAPTLGGDNGSIYGPGQPVVIWQQPVRGSSPGAHAVMQSDGNFVLYSAANQVLWASDTAGNPGARLVVQDDANVVVYSRAGTALWQSGSVSRLDADSPGAHLRMCPWQAGQGVVGFSCPVLATVPDTVGVTMLCWMSVYTPPNYGNYHTDKWFYVSVDGGRKRGFVNASLVTTASQIPTPACRMTQQPAAQPTTATTSTPAAGSSGGSGSPSPSRTRSVSLARGPGAPSGYWYAITVAGFAPRASVAVECFDSVSPRGFRSFVLTTGADGAAHANQECYSADGPQHWVTANGVKSNLVAWSRPSPAPTAAPTTTAAPPATLDADATPAFGTCPSSPPPANEVYCGGWSSSCNSPAFSKANCPVYVSQGTRETPVCWTTGQTIYNNYSAAAPGPAYTLQSDIWIKVRNYAASPWMNELWFDPDNTASNNLPHC